MGIHKAFLFRVEIDGFASAEFKTCSELTVEQGEISIRQGGSLIATKDPGLVSFPDIVLGRGKTNDKDFYNWLKLCVDVNSGRGTVPADDVKKDWDLVVLDRNDDELGRFRVYKSWPKIRTIGPWDNDAEEYLMESTTMACERWDEL